MKHLFIIYLGILFENENKMANDKKYSILTQYNKSKCIEVFQLSIKSGCNFCWHRTRNSFTKIMEWRIDKNSEVIKKNDNFQLGSLEECVCRALG